MHYLPFFGKIRLQAYQEAIKKYCQTVGYTGFELTDKEIEQLSWYMESKIVTPEERSDVIFARLHFEIKRGLARYYSFVLILRGDDAAYRAFIKDQNSQICLSGKFFRNYPKKQML